MTDIPMSNVNIAVNVDQFVTAETVKLIFKATIVLSGTYAEVEPKPTVLAGANEITKGDWYVTNADRREGDGGIEVVEYSLNVRVKDSEITKVKNAIRGVNKPGLKFELVDTDYTPTQAQLEEANKVLRKKVYARANEELEILNELITSGEGTWLVGTISFGQQGYNKSLRATPAAAMYNSFNESAGGSEEEESGITQKVSLGANVSFTKKIYSRV